MNQHSVIIGAKGRLGGALRTACESTQPVTALGRQEMDLENPDAIRKVLSPLSYDKLWLTAALTNVDYCESHPEESARVNSEAVKIIAQISAEKGAQVILFSTDYVFDGEKNEAYVEDDATHPLSIYGQSKQQAEKHLLAASDQHLAIRLSWLFGNNKPGFPEWVIRQAMEKNSLSIVSDRLSCPTYTGDLIDVLQPMILGEMKISGILHLCNQGVCTWQEWGQYCLDCAVENGIPLQIDQIQSCLMSDIKSFAAQRPPFSAMSTARFESLGGQAMPDWKQGVSRYIREQLASQFTN